MNDPIGELDDINGNSRGKYPAKKQKKNNNEHETSSAIPEIQYNKKEPIDELDDMNGNSYGKYPAKKQKKKQSSFYDVNSQDFSSSAKEDLSFEYSRTILGNEQRDKMLGKLNNCVLVDFDIRLNVEKKEKQKFTHNARKRFLKYVAAEHADELKAKGFTEKEIEKIKKTGDIEGEDKNYSVHHKFPRYFAEAMGIAYNDINNLILVNENEHGDDYFHAIMDSITIEAVDAAKKQIKGVHSEISFGKYLKKTGKTIKMTIPWPVGAVYLTPEQQKEYERIAAGKPGKIDFSPAAVLKKAEEEMKAVSVNYADRCEHPEKYPELKNARQPSPQSADGINAAAAVKKRSSRDL